MRWIAAGGAIGFLAVLVGVAIAVVGRPAPAEPYRLSDPDMVLDAAWEMIEQGEAGRLAELIYAESPEMESVLARLGKLLGSLQSLADAVQERFPDDVQRIKREMESSGGAGRGVGAMFGAAQRAAERGPDERFLARVFADPYGWIQRSRDRVTTVYLTDETRAVMIDGQPAFGFGLTMREDDGRWRIVIPLGLPVVSRYAPRNRSEWEILASMVTVLDNAVVDLTTDVRRGQARTLDDAARLAGEKAWFPMVMCIVAYQKAMEARERASAQVQ